MPVWIREKLFLKKIIYDGLKEIAPSIKKSELLFAEHHLSHAASAYYPSPFEEAAILDHRRGGRVGYSLHLQG